MKPAKRLTQLPPYIFSALDRAKSAARRAGHDLIDLGVGDPDQPTPSFILKAMQKAMRNPATHQYPAGKGSATFREAIADWYRKRFGVKLNPDTEILVLVGSKEGITHLPFALCNAADRVLIPEPAYPAYRSACLLAGTKILGLPLTERNVYLPDLDYLRKVSRHPKTKLLYLNYPNNPTGAVAPPSFFRKVTAIAKRNRFTVAHDAAYSEMAYGAYRPVSFLQAPGAKAVGVEFHSLSKTFNMTGWRIGWVCGNAQVIEALTKFKSNMDSGLFEAIQTAGIAALKAPRSRMKPQLKLYQDRRDLLIRGLHKLGVPVASPKATFYLWITAPKGMTSANCAKQLLQKASIVVTPGNGFGPHGEGYIRMALTVPKNRLREAIRRLDAINLWKSRT